MHRRHVFSQGYAKFKNGMAWDDAEAESRVHLRVVLLLLGTRRFTKPVRRKMGDVRAGPDVRADAVERLPMRETVPRYPQALPAAR